MLLYTSISGVSDNAVRVKTASVCQLPTKCSLAVLRDALGYGIRKKSWLFHSFTSLSNQLSSPDSMSQL